VNPDGTVSAAFGAGGVEPAGFVDALLPSQPAPGDVWLDEELPPPEDVFAPDVPELALNEFVAEDREDATPPSAPAAPFVPSELPQAIDPTAEAAHTRATRPRIARMFTSVPERILPASGFASQCVNRVRSIAAAIAR
jgi:hypothetical protein